MIQIARLLQRCPTRAVGSKTCTGRMNPPQTRVRFGPSRPGVRGTCTAGTRSAGSSRATPRATCGSRLAVHERHNSWQQQSDSWQQKDARGGAHQRASAPPAPPAAPYGVTLLSLEVVYTATDGFSANNFLGESLSAFSKQLFEC
jgi:hypothetical protein